MMPFSSRSLMASSPTFGISRVISSGPSLVSRASTSYFSIWTELNRSSDLDDAVFIEVLDGILAHVRDITGDFLRTKFGITRFNLVFFDMDRSEPIFRSG